MHALLGENGAGKSTLIRVVAGAHRPDSGAFRVDGKALERVDPMQARALGIAVIYQQPALFPDLSVAENIALGREKGAPWTPDRRAAAPTGGARAARRGSGPAVDPDALVSGLRMAEQQLVEIARALGSRARILVMDEPTAALSEHEASHLLGVVRELRASGRRDRLRLAPARGGAGARRPLHGAARRAARRDARARRGRPRRARAPDGGTRAGREAATRRVASPGAPLLELRQLSCSRSRASTA